MGVMQFIGAGHIARSLGDIEEARDLAYAQLPGLLSSMYHCNRAYLES